MARVRAAEYDDRRETILDRAAALFARNGFDRTSMNALSEACGASKAWLYHYYDGKEAILYDILDTHIRHLLDTVETTRDKVCDPESRLALLVERLMRAYENADAKHKVLLNEMAALAPGKRRLIQEMETRIVDVFAQTIAEINPDLSDRRLLKPVTMSLLGMLNWHFTWFRKDGSLTREDYARLATHLFLDGARGLQP